MLNLDSDDEIIIEEDDKSECILCKYTNHEFLDHLYYTLCGSTSKNNMYTTLFDTFDKRMKELDRQGFESHKLKKDELRIAGLAAEYERLGAFDGLGKEAIAKIIRENELKEEANKKEEEIGQVQDNLI